MTTGDGWMPGAIRVPVTGFWSGNSGRKAVVLHVVEGSAASCIATFKGGGVSAHFLIDTDGTIYQFVSINDSAWGNGLGYKNGVWTSPEGNIVHPSWPLLEAGVNPNLTTISIEHAGHPQDAWTPPMDASNTRVLAWIAGETGLVYAPLRSLIGHCDISPIDRPNCPGPHVDYARIATAANAAAPQTATGLTFAHAPRISVDTFRHVLQQAVSPAADNAASLYSIPISYGLDPGVALAFFGHESSFGTQGRAVQNLSWGNVRAPQNPALSSGVDADGFARYGSWLLSLTDWCERITKKYIPNGWSTVELAVPHYAPSSDGNNEQAYIRAIYGFLDQWPALSQTDYAALWGAKHPEIPYLPTFGFPSRWRHEYDTGFPLGAVLTQEVGDDPVFQVFEAGVLRLDKRTGKVTVLR